MMLVAKGIVSCSSPASKALGGASPPPLSPWLEQHWLSDGRAAQGLPFLLDPFETMIPALDPLLRALHVPRPRLLCPCRPALGRLPSPLASAARGLYSPHSS